MNTKCTVLPHAQNESTNSVSEKKPIEFFQLLDYDSSKKSGNVRPPNAKPCAFDYVELVAEAYVSCSDGTQIDLIFAYDDDGPRGEGFLYLGRWNDGVVK